MIPKKLLDYYLKNGVFLRGNIPSLKNSKEIQIYKKWMPDPTDPGSRILRQLHRLGPSKSVSKYTDAFGYTYPMNKVDIQNLFPRGKYPWIMGVYFIRDSKRKFDFNNATQIIQDMMVDNGYLPDDDMDNLWPVPLGYHVDKENAGAIVCNMGGLYSFEPILRQCEGLIKLSPVDQSPEIDHALWVINLIKEITK
jgi:hypothetical protein